MIEVGFGPSGPTDVMQDEPPLREKFVQFLGHLGLARGSRGPRALCTFGLLEFAAQLRHTLRR
jgi:hypothetical protein